MLDVFNNVSVLEVYLDQFSLAPILEYRVIFQRNEVQFIRTLMQFLFERIPPKLHTRTGTVFPNSENVDFMVIIVLKCNHVLPRQLCMMKQ